MNSTARFYSQPSYVGGVPFNVYSGSRRQTGGSVFGAVKRAVLPTLKTAGKEMGKQAIGLFKDVAQDVLSGENLGDSIKQRAKERAAEAARRGIQTLSNSAAQALSRSALKRPATSLPRAVAPPRKRPRRRTTHAPAVRRRRRPPPVNVNRRPPIRRMTRQRQFMPRYRHRPFRGVPNRRLF